MTDLVPTDSLICVNDEQRRSAALTIAEASGENRRRAAYFLVALGLADHRADGKIVARREHGEGTWFSQRDRSQAIFRATPGTLDEARQ